MNIRQIALRILDEYEMGGKFINLALSSHLTDKLSGEEKAALTALLYTSVERKLTYDYYICALSKRSESDIDLHTKNILRLGLCQLLDMRSIPDFAAVNETVKLTSNPGERSFVNGVLRAAARQKDNLPMPDEKKNYKRYLSVKYAFPLSVVKHFDSLYGRDETEKILEIFNTEKYTDITVNTTGISVNEYKRSLEETGITVCENSAVPISLRIKGSVNPERLFGFSDGYFFVQDRASAICASVLDASEGEVVIDTCAAPGGKSFFAAIAASDKCEIHSFDLHSSKLSLITSGALRLGLNSIVAEQRDALTPCESLLGKADKVICDAPCSGLGVLGKKPDLRYKDFALTEELPALQLSILEAAAGYLKQGGVLVYSTCTLNPKENEEVVLSFLDKTMDFALEPFSVGDISSENGMLTLLPSVHNTDGFFMAKIVRKN
ncbi:MAG: 16S rRNA (cytosine(967)-C(5))-methyltransferase RsmB [Clostridia bacterium]|nr:16S rRNA (cytosine(967)-C(5))-methyltransferase RsmB [Clostridia bacterium]